MADAKQAEMWKGSGGSAWVEAQDLVDGLFRPLEERLVAAVPEGADLALLDVGCGTGGTTIALARRLGPGGRATGVDISEPMIGAARTRAANEGAKAAFVVADAESHDFAPASFDRIVSRFGVMFFDDPVAAFTNLRRAARPGAGLQLLAWRGAEDNPFMTTAERAAAPLLPNLPPRRPDEPGQFGFGNRDRVARILADSGWSDIDIRPIDFECRMPEAALLPYITRFGPVGRMLDEADEATRARVIAAVRPAFDGFVHGGEVRLTAACWEIGGRNAGR